MHAAASFKVALVASTLGQGKTWGSHNMEAKKQKLSPAALYESVKRPKDLKPFLL